MKLAEAECNRYSQSDKRIKKYVRRSLKRTKASEIDCICHKGFRHLTKITK